MQGITLTYKAAVTGVGNYLSAEVDGEINRYQMKMLENNEIPGLLPVRGSMFNGICHLSYEMEGMRRLSAVLAGGRLRGAEAKRFMGGLLRALSGLGEYFLSYMQCLLETDYIYVDERGRARLVYLPLSGRTVTEEETVRVFCQKLFAEYFTSDGDPFFLNLLRYVNMQDFSFAGLLERFAREDGEEERPRPARPQDAVSAREESKPKPQGATVQAVFDVPGTTPGTDGQDAAGNFASGSGVAGFSPQKDGGAGFAIPGNPGFAVPGGADFSVPQSGKMKKGDAKKEAKEKKEKEKEKEKEKGGSLLKALLGKKDKPAEKREENGRRSDRSNEPSIPQAAGGRGYQAGSGINPGDGASEPGGWRGTVILGADAEESGGCTVLLGMGDAPYLLYRGMRISMDHFPFSVGRDNADFVIDKGAVSRLHIRIGSRNGGYYVTDENSKNHTYLNGQRLAPYTEAGLKDGDELRLADESMTFHL